MSSRHDSRVWATQILFQFDFNNIELDMALTEFWNQQSADDASRTFTEKLVRGVREHLTELDQKIQQYAENWDLKRMGAVDRNVMRMGMYEMFYCEDIPPVVSINEAVDIAKSFGSQESGKFVNGILDRARKDLDRPARSA
jgi:N utilization substance protein B